MDTTVTEDLAAHAKPVQHEEELAQLIELLQRENVRSYLEVGVERGGTFRRVMMSLPKGSLGIAVDLPVASVDEFTRSILGSVLAELRAAGRDVWLVVGDGRDVMVSLRGLPSFDAVLIDADHSYAAVKSDFENYGPMARIVIFHDIKSESSCIDVRKFWDEIKWQYRFEEIVHTGGAAMGLGILYMNEKAA